MTDLDFDFHGVRLELLPERAAFRPDRRELLLADVHLGKAAAFRRAGKPLPKGTTRSELARIDALAARKGAERITFLGDLFHAEVDVQSPTAAAFAEWLASPSSAAADITLVRGNHDRHAKDLIDALPLTALPEPLPTAGLDYRHHPGGDRPHLAGHIHPGVRIEDGADAMKLPAFWASGPALVLPAFGAFTGLFIIDTAPGDRIALATPTGVVEVPRELSSRR